MLTQKQRDLLIFIHNRMTGGDVAPSFDEMRQALSLKSKSGIHRLVNGLVERGYLERLPNRARALQVKQLPEGLNAGQNKTAGQESATDTMVNTIPLYGRIAAGSPIEAIRDENGSVAVPPDMITTGNFYALEVDGDSMIKAGIHDGDLVIIKRVQTALPGQIVVALVDGEEVTLKRLEKEENKVVLYPENDDYEKQVYAPEQVQVQGVLSSLMRNYH